MSTHAVSQLASWMLENPSIDDVTTVSRSGADQTPGGATGTTGVTGVVCGGPSSRAVEVSVFGARGVRPEGF